MGPAPVSEVQEGSLRKSLSYEDEKLARKGQRKDSKRREQAGAEGSMEFRGRGEPVSPIRVVLNSDSEGDRMEGQEE